MKVAIVHDCLTVYGGAERVLKEILTLFSSADLFALVNFLPDSLFGKKAQTSFIQKLPFANRIYRYYFPLMPYAIENFDLSSYDLIISSSYAVAKGVVTNPEQLHICYCHSPMRYAWDMRHLYAKKGLEGLCVKKYLHKLRLWDVASSFRVDQFIANSEFVKKRIMKIYRRPSIVIYPAVDISRFSGFNEKQDFYLTCSRLVDYKNVGLIVETFSSMLQRKLIVIGDGPEYGKIAKIAGPNVKMLGSVDDQTVAYYMQRAKGFIFAAKEDFGIVCVEAQSAGTGVIAFGQGGALETVKGLDENEPTGCFFYQQTKEALTFAVEQFELNQHRITRLNCRKNAQKFSKERFHRELSEYIHQEFYQYESDFACGRQWGASMAHFSKDLSKTIFPH